MVVLKVLAVQRRGYRFSTRGVGMRRVLVTGFGPFADHATNPSWEVAKALAGEHHWEDPLGAEGDVHAHVEALLLAVDAGGASTVAQRIAEGERWDVVLHVGLCGSCTAGRLERRGRDAFAMTVPDNAGRQQVDGPITGRGDLMADAQPEWLDITRCDPAATWSDDAGGYVCNETLLMTLDARGSASNPSITFLHIPPEHHWSVTRSAAMAKQVILNMLCPPVVDVAAGALFDDGRLLVGRRASSEAASGLWELPGGKFEPNEALEDAVVREWQEELHLAVRAGARRGSWWGRTGRARYRINVIEVQPVEGSLDGFDAEVHDRLEWIDATVDLDAYAWLGPDRDVVAHLLGIG